MMNVFTKTFTPPEVSEAEILRYAGVREVNEQTLSLMRSALGELLPLLSYKVCYLQSPIHSLPREIASSKRIEGCESAVVFAATLGVWPDRLIAKHGVSSPSRALLIQAIGAERIEALCDLFCSEYKNALPRFSPGYGELSLEVQQDIFTLLNPEKNIGLFLNGSLLMSPSKSVSAIFGIRSKK